MARTYHHRRAAIFAAQLDEALRQVQAVAKAADEYLEVQPGWSICDPASAACAKQALQIIDDLEGQLDHAVDLLYRAATVEPEAEPDA